MFSFTYVFVLLFTSFASACVDKAIQGQYSAWSCAQLGGLLIGPGQGYCNDAGIAAACCACGGVAPSPTAGPSDPVANPTSQPTAAVTTPPPTEPVTGDCKEAWAQCGGNDYGGVTCCTAGNVCVEQSEWYSQCEPETVPVPSVEPTAPVTPQPTNPAPITAQPTNAVPVTPQPTNAVPVTQQPTAPVTPQPTAPVTPHPTNPTGNPNPMPTPEPTAAVTPEPTSAPVEQPTNGGDATDAWNVCYFTNWARYRSGAPNTGKDVFEMDFPADLCTHFMYGFATVTQDFDIKSSDKNADHPGMDEPCPAACNDPSFVTDWSDPNGLRCDWPCSPGREMRGYEGMNVGMKRKNSAIKSLISVGGWNFNDCAASPADTVGQGYATCELFSTIAKDEAKTRTFAQNAINFMRKWGFDGFDIDWEYPVVAGHISAQMYELDGSPAAYNINRLKAGELVFHDVTEDYANYITMLRIMREEFQKQPEKFLLTAAVGVGKSTVETAYNIPEMNKYLDQINLMTYDMHGGWESRTGCNANLYATAEDVAYGGGVGAGVAVQGYPLSVSWAVDYWIAAGADPLKLTMGIGTYGRGWKLADPNNTGYNAPASGSSTPGASSKEAGYLAYYEIKALLDAGLATRHYENDRACPYIVTNDGEWIGYDDQESLAAKMSFLRSRNIRGTMSGPWIWTISLVSFTEVPNTDTP